ncbi:MAG: DUF934 domain-containing protein [Rhizobiales bacterium]|nr:DUF934 domain-containing protein [Hyphomicrobiales bacterium]
MPLVKNGKIIDDPYLRVLDDAPVPDDTAVIVPAERLLADAGDFALRAGRTGVLWPNARNVSDLVPHLERLSLVALIFPTFRDGRAYSQARILRERYNFRGELRATGDILRDQFLFLHRAGFNAFEVAKATDASAFVDVIRRFSVFYQPAADGQSIALRRRLDHTGSRSATNSMA